MVQFCDRKCDTISLHTKAIDLLPESSRKANHRDQYTARHCSSMGTARSKRARRTAGNNSDTTRNVGRTDSARRKLGPMGRTDADTLADQAGLGNRRKTIRLVAYATSFIIKFALARMERPFRAISWIRNKCRSPDSIFQSWLPTICADFLRARSGNGRGPHASTASRQRYASGA
jgi:hypothetical protein